MYILAVSTRVLTAAIEIRRIMSIRSASIQQRKWSLDVALPLCRVSSLSTSSSDAAAELDNDEIFITRATVMTTDGNEGEGVARRGGGWTRPVFDSDQWI